MEILLYPKWIELPDSTPENRRGIVVQNAEEEKALLARLIPSTTASTPPPAEEPASKPGSYWKPFTKRG